MNKPARKRRALFYPCYFCLLILAASLGGLALATLWFALSDYERTRPIHAAEAVAAPFLLGDFAAAYGEDDLDSIF